MRFCRAALKQKTLLIVVLLALLLASFGVWSANKKIMPGADSDNYRSLAQSVLDNGQFSLNGQTTMWREPGYPLFLATFLFLSGDRLVFGAQIILFCLTVLLVSDCVLILGLRKQRLLFLVPILAYGLAIYTGHLLVEIFVAFLVALASWLYLQGTKKSAPTDRYRFWLGVTLVLGCLVLTRFPFFFFALVLLLAIFGFEWRVAARPLAAAVLIFLFCVGVWFLCLLPWLIRNHYYFDRWAITERTGQQLYIRVLKANESWGRLADTYKSVLLGHGLAYLIDRDLSPINLELWKNVTVDHRQIKKENPLLNPDRVLMARARASFANSPISWQVRFLAWTGVEELRMFGLPSFRSPEFSMEQMYYEKIFRYMNNAAYRLITPRAEFYLMVSALILGSLLQLVWWVLIFLALGFGFKKFGLKFIPGLIIISVAVVYAPADLIVRYAAPIQPWIAGAIILLIDDKLDVLKNKNKNKNIQPLS